MDSQGKELAEPHLGSLFAGFGLDVEYTRASGNSLYRLDERGAEVEVLDATGGYGSLILGHHRPELVAEAKRLLDAGTPIHAQFSRRAEANEVAALLNTIVRRETGAAEDFTSIFANSGAEAIEVALKHAELERVVKLTALRDEIAADLDRARAAVLDGAAVVPEETWALLGLAGDDWDPAGGFDRLAAKVTSVNEAAFAAPPVFLTVEGSFHGKLAGSVQLTHNENFRLPFRALAAQARFIPFNDPGAIGKAVDEERVTALHLTVRDGAVTVGERVVPTLAAFVVEPILGEGGIREISPEFAREAQRVFAEAGCPIVLDEIQSGMGRTGSFFASSGIGLRGDYYALAKSLGGGIAKVSVVLLRVSRYQKAFEYVHSSTFAKDSFSSSLALKTLRLLEAEDGAAYRRAAERGAALAAMLERVREDFPEVVREVRGRGLMLGVEFRSQSDAVSGFIRAKYREGVFGWVASGYLLWEHGIRIAPTASASSTLRLEPSLYLTDAEIGRLDAALRALCSVLRNQDALHLLHPVSDRRTPKPRTEIRDFRSVRGDSAVQNPTTPEEFRAFDPSLADLSDETLLSHIERVVSLGE
ncbi:aminotransferase class III-fold pyridoxal phosphate-dependent enzyme [Streptomyces amakusaensis]|uniref:Aspartate aminotransferase family protein n=1 Tax=Streptomyces amakusaensis TaxID=67271 RepID=A0ABW0AUS1_9ACTN